MSRFEKNTDQYLESLPEKVKEQLNHLRGEFGFWVEIGRTPDRRGQTYYRVMIRDENDNLLVYSPGVELRAAITGALRGLQRVLDRREDLSPIGAAG